MLDSFKIDHNSPIPLYYQLREEFRRLILSGELKFGEELPSELELCQKFNLSRSTVKQALDRLIYDDLIVRKRGKGTFVKYKSYIYDLLEEPNFYLKIDSKGIKQRSVIIDSKYIESDNKISSIFNINKSEKIAYFKRVRYIDDIPTIIQDVYIPLKYEKKILNQDLSSISFHKYVEDNNGIKLNNFNTQVNSIILNEYESKLLSLDSLQSAFLINTTYYSFSTPYIYGERIFRGDKFSLLLKYSLENNQYSAKVLNNK